MAPSRVTLTVVAASVRVAAPIVVASFADRSAAATALRSSLVDAAAASTLLGVAVISAPVVQQLQLAELLPAPSPPPALPNAAALHVSKANTAGSGSGSSGGVIAGAGGAAALVVLVLGVALRRRSLQRTKSATSGTPTFVSVGPAGGAGQTSSTASAGPTKMAESEGRTSFDAPGKASLHVTHI